MDELTATLTALQRLALAYSPSSARGATLGLLAFDCRLAQTVRSASEPMLAQLKLAWWRELLVRPARDWPPGEPLVACLRYWEAETGTLTGLVDGWEAMTGPAPLPAEELDRLARARGEAFGALAALLGEADRSGDATRMGRCWAIADIASRLSNQAERDAALELAGREDWSARRLSRKLRPLAVLHGLAARSMRVGEPLEPLSPGELLLAMRLGLLGL